MKTSDLVISEAVQRAQDSLVTLRFADVTAVDGRTVTVLLDGVSVPDVPCLGTYDPTVDDRAWLLVQGTTIVALGSNTVPA